MRRLLARITALCSLSLAVTLTPALPAQAADFAVQSVANGLYVSAENNFTGADAGMLRARTPANRIGSWELFRMGFPEPYPGQGKPGAPSPTPRERAQVMSWNVCANNNSACGNHRDDGDAVATALAQHMNATLGSAYHPDVLLLQEICERHTRTIESYLESRTGRGWDVRFAPIKVESEYRDLTLEKRCRDDQGGNDRGLYGVAVAVPEENTRYFSRELRAEWGTVAEQRVALCAAKLDYIFARAHTSCAVSRDNAHSDHRSIHSTVTLH